ncbi:MAG: AraC family transcriptional regulator ligand-binding domain-containing protein [Gluconacetobacter diazotrophicus]|nr:AraC family transcriptional regulator ligand-binding domain-containing protein [Gluconacetobacter diazotrophicus]
MADCFRVSGLLARQLRERGVSVEAVRRHARLPEAFFRQARILATTEELFALWGAVAAVSGDPAMGMKLGGEDPMESGTPQSVAALYSESFRDALQRMARYKKLVCPEEIRLHSTRDEYAVEFVFLLGGQEEPPLLVDLCLAWALAIGRRGTGVPIRPLRLELARPPAHREVLEAHYGCRVRFGAGRNALVFRPGDVERPFLTHNPDLLEILGTQFEAELSARQTGRSLGDEVKAVLKRLLAGRRPAIGDVARSLGLSRRTLQRRLADGGETFQGLLQEARRDLARHYLGQGTLELAETAYLLGFDDANSFFRAFHRWEGTSPKRWQGRRGQSSAVHRTDGTDGTDHSYRTHLSHPSH